MLALASDSPVHRHLIGRPRNPQNQVIGAAPACSAQLVTVSAESAIGTLYTNDNKAELTIVVAIVICRPAHKYVRTQHPLFGR